MIVTTDYDEAVKADPRKKGVALYRVGDEEDWRWTWARTSDQALAIVARYFGATAEKYIVGTTHEGSIDGI